jgi:hypothetical protein
MPPETTPQPNAGIPPLSRGRTRRRRLWIAAAAVVILAGAGIFAASRPPARGNVLVADDAASIRVMDFAAPMSLDPLPPGWWHRKFWTRRAATFSLVGKDGNAALKVATDDSASMLWRYVDFDLAAYPVLRWRWFVEQPIESTLDERSKDGDDHPARLYPAFRNGAGERRALEIIWGNRVLHRGDVKYRCAFPHYVANGGMESIGRWHDERVDLLALFRRFWPKDKPGRLTDIAVFCDSDETGTRSVSYFADIRLDRGPPPGR